MLLFTGTIMKHKYAITIREVKPRCLTDREGNEVKLKVWIADITIADRHGHVVHAFNRDYDARWGEWSVDGIKRNMLNEARQDLS